MATINTAVYAVILIQNELFITTQDFLNKISAKTANPQNAAFVILINNSFIDIAEHHHYYVLVLITYTRYT